MTKGLLHLETDDRVLQLAEECPEVRSVVGLLVARAVVEEPDRPLGYGLEWLKRTGFGEAVRKLLEAGLVKAHGDRLLLVSEEEPISATGFVLAEPEGGVE